MKKNTGRTILKGYFDFIYLLELSSSFAVTNLSPSGKHEFKRNRRKYQFGPEQKSQWETKAPTAYSTEDNIIYVNLNLLVRL